MITRQKKIIEDCIGPFIFELFVVDNKFSTENNFQAIITILSWIYEIDDDDDFYVL